MATATRAITVEGDQSVEFLGIGWRGYLTMLRLRGEKSTPRMIYLDGDVLLVSPSYSHEWLKMRFGHFVAEVVVGMEIPFIMAGSTTYRRRKKKGGFEPDQSYYLTNCPRIKGKKDIHLKTDPPPDLAIEVVCSHGADRALEVSRRLGIPEVWVCDDAGLRLLTLGPNRRYGEVAASPSFPTLTPAEIFGWVTRDSDDYDTDWIIELRRWVLDVLAPRVPDRAEPR